MDIPMTWIEAAARALQSSRMMQQYGHPAPPEAWDESPDYIREDWLKHATACLAAVFGKADLVASNGSGSGSEYRVSVSMESMGPHVGGVELTPFVLRCGDTLVIVRGW